MEAIGKAAISSHNATQKHKNSARQTKSNQSVKAFFKSQSAPTTLDYKTAAAEGTWAFHTVKHQQSFLSNDCTSQKFTSVRTKTKSITTRVLGPYAQKILLSELGTQPFSVLVDASNHNLLELFSLVIRFYNAKVGVQVRLLYLRSMPSETSQQIIDFIHTSLQENDLDLKRLTSFCADNAPVNFGSSQLSGQNNVLYRLKQRAIQLNSVGSPAHILHNEAEKGSDCLTVDITTIVMKIGSHFKSQTSRTLSLKQFCEKLDTNYSTLPTHTPTRWTTLDSVLEPMIDLWEPLKAHFLSLKHPPRIFMDFFKLGESLVVVTFLHNALLLFKKPILLLQETTALFPELTEIVESFKCSVQFSRFFISATCRTKYDYIWSPQKKFTDE